MKQPVYLQRHVTKDIMRRFHYAHTVSHSYIPAAAPCRAGDGCMEWYDKSSVQPGYCDTQSTNREENKTHFLERKM